MSVENTPTPRSSAELDPFVFVKNVFPVLKLRRFGKVAVDELCINSEETKRFLIEVGIPDAASKPGIFEFVTPLNFELPPNPSRGRREPKGGSAIHVANLASPQNPVFLDEEGVVFGCFEGEDGDRNWYISRSLEVLVAQVVLILGYERRYHHDAMTPTLHDAFVSTFVKEMQTLDPDVLSGYWQIFVEEVSYGGF